MKYAILLVVLLAVAIVNASRQEFETFKKKYNKSYSSPVENEYRYKIFEQSLKRIAARQSKSTLTRFGVTKFSDLTVREFRNKYLMKPLKMDTLAEAPLGVWDQKQRIMSRQLPDSFDWGTDKNMVTDVKNQEQCGDCWAFSATECIESVYAIAGNALPVLAPQQILDCDTTDSGCNGGYPYTAFQYVIGAGGQDTEASYPYTAEQGNCNFQQSNIAGKINNWNYVTQSSDENAMQQYLYSTSPISVCVDAEAWQDYNGGVMDANACGGNTLDHAVQATGWSQQNGTTVWNVRNSWGADWGENGYIYLTFGQDTCGVADLVTAPTE